jgi:hypothetical protein
VFDGDPQDPDAQSKLDYTKCFAFKDFKLVTNPMEYEFSNIDHRDRNVIPERDYFTSLRFRQNGILSFHADSGSYLYGKRFYGADHCI